MEQYSFRRYLLNGYFEAGTILGSYPNTLRQSSVWFRDKVLITFLPFQSVQFSLSVFATPWTAGCQASLSITNPRSLLKLMSVESVMPSNHLILYCPLLLQPSVFPSSLQSSPASGSFPVSQFFMSGGQSILPFTNPFIHFV